MLSQVNYRVPNMRFLRERLTVRDSQAVYRPSVGAAWEPLAAGLTGVLSCAVQDLEQRSSDITYGQFAQLYRSLMYSAQKTVHEPPSLPRPLPLLSRPSPSPACLSPAALLEGFWVPFLQLFSLRPAPLSCPSLSS